MDRLIFFLLKFSDCTYHSIFFSWDQLTYLDWRYIHIVLHNFVLLFTIILYLWQKSSDLDKLSKIQNREKKIEKKNIGQAWTKETEQLR